MLDRARKIGAMLLSASLVIGVAPVTQNGITAPQEAQAAQVAKVTFENKSKAEVEEMMKHMTIDEIVDAMPLKDKVSQLFVTYSGDIYSNSAGSPMASYTQLSAAAKNRLASYPVGGVCYFLGDIKNQSQIQSVSNSFQASNKYGMFLAVDEEGGRVQRIGGTTYDGAKRGAGIGTQVNAMYTYKDQGTSVAKSNAMALADNLLMTGMNWDFAPVADTNSNPSNTVIGYRAYSNDYNQGAELVSAAISGFHEKNVMTSIKHFPGHGDTSTDSHAGAALVNKNFSQLLKEDLIPFKAGINAGTDSVMLGHLSYIRDDGTLSSDAGLIATNSSEVITDLLRTQLGFDGIVITDGMQMGALTNLYGKSSTTTKAGTVTGTKYNGYITAAIDYFVAGGDMFLLCGTPFQAIDAIITEVGLGTISEDRIDESVTRVMKAKRQYNIIPAQEDDAEATYISSDGAMEHGTFAAMWSKASTQALQSGKPAPVVRLNKNITANSNGSFGTGTNIATNGDLTLTANHSVTIDLNGFTLNKNLSGSSSAGGKHIFNIPANATVTIHDSSSAQDGKIIGAGGDVGTVAYATGASAKFIVDSGNITGNAGTSLIYSDASAVVRFGIKDVAGNNAGPVNITNNTAEYAVDFSGTMYLMGETAINDNGGANLYFNGANSMVNIQDRGLTGGKESIGVSIADVRASNPDLFKPAPDVTLTGNDLNALFCDDNAYQLELDTNIKLVKVDGDVRFVSSDGSINDTGTWDEMFAQYASKRAGTLTLLKDVSITSNVSKPEYQATGNQDSPYKFSYNTVIDLNGKKLNVSTNARNIFQVLNNAEVIINDTHSPSVSKTQVQQGGNASYDANRNTLTVYVDEYDGEGLSTFKTAYDFSAAGLISMNSTNADVDGAIDLVSGKVTMNGGAFNCNGNGRAIAVKTGTTFTMNNGYLFNGRSAGHASSVWAFGKNALASINGGVIAANVSSNTASGSSGALGAYSYAKVNITGGIFTGNSSTGNHGGAITTGIPTSSGNQDNTVLSVSGGTICHNTTQKNGGGLYVNSSTETAISNVLISSNNAQSGAGIYMNGSSKVTLSGNTAIVKNNAVASSGGIYNATSGKLSIKDNIVVKDNVANGAKSDIAVIANGNKVSVNGALTSPSHSIGVDLPNAAPGNVFATGNGYTVQASDAGKFFIDSDETLFGSLDGNNNIYLEQGEAQYVSPDGNMENGNFEDLWSKHFSSGKSGTITLMKDVTLSDDSQLVLETKASQATLDLNGKNLVLANNRTDNESPIYIPSGSFEICDSSATASTAKTVVDVPAGTRAILSDDLNKLTYYTTEHEQNGIVTYKNDADLSAIGYIRYTGGSDPNGIVHVGTSGTFTLTNGLLNCTNGRAILNGMSTGTCTSKVNINGGYIAGCKAGLASVLLAQRGSTTNINGGVIAGNMNPTGRGTVWMNSVGMNMLSMTGGIISGNYAKGGSNAEQGGGAILVEYSNTSATITGGMITHNSTDANGGGICYATAAPANGLSISNVVISANKSSKNGGGIYSGRNINDPNCHIDANEASGRGGAIYTTAGLIANSLCTSENVAGQSAGIYAANGITMKGKISIEDNVSSGGIASNLDIKHLPADKVQIVGALETGSKIGLSIAKSSTERNQKVVSSTIGLNDSYSDIFYDDADENHVLRFNDGNDGLYLIQEDIEGDELIIATPNRNYIPIVAKNCPDLRGNKVGVSIHGPGDGTHMQYGYYTNIGSLVSNTLGSTNSTWCRNFFKPVVINDQTYYELVEIHKYEQNIASNQHTIPKDWIVLTYWAGGSANALPDTVRDPEQLAKKLISEMTVGTYVTFDFDPATSANGNEKVDITNGTYPNTAQYSPIGNFAIVDPYAAPAKVSYKIHYIHHYPVSEVMTGEYYVEDQTRMVEKTGVVGQLAYVPFDDIAGYLVSDSHNCISTTLQEAGTKGGADWYYQDDNFQGMHGSADSINDLYVIYEHSEEEYTYNVEYYDADSGRLIKVDENLTATAFPIKATTSMKTLHEYEYDTNNANNIDTIESSSSNMLLKLYFKKWPTYTVEYYDADTMDRLDEGIKATYVSKPIKAGSAVSITDLSNSLKTIDGYDYVNKDGYTVNAIDSVAQDGSSKMKLYFEKIIKRPYTIEYYDKDTGKIIGIIEKEPVRTGTVVTLAKEDEEYVIQGQNRKYRLASDDERNILSCEIPRNGVVPSLKVYAQEVFTTDVRIERYEYDGTKWKLMGLPVLVECDENTDFNVLSAENKLLYVDGISGYIFLPNDPKNVTTVHVGTVADLTPIVKLYYAKVNASGDAVQKTPNDNGLVPIKRASTKDFINIELYDYGRSINDKATSTGSYPIFKGYPAMSGSYIKNIGNAGETVQYDAVAAEAGDKKGYSTSTSGLINRLAASSVDNKRAQGANAPVNGFSYDYVGGRQTTPSKNPMKNELSADGTPVLADGTSLSYLFNDSNDVSPSDPYDFTTKKIASGIDGLFDYDADTGYYSYSSVKNHAEYNEKTNTFDVYDKIITPNLSDYAFGNFMPFTKINERATPSKEINREYIQNTIKYARYKASTESDADLRKRYGALANGLESIDSRMASRFGAKYTYKEISQRAYYPDGNLLSWGAAAGTGVIPKNVVNPQNCFVNPITNEKYFESADDFYDKLYMIDYDEIKNFFFGITFDFDFVQPQDGQIGTNRQDMIFDFEGDDDVLIYIDGKLFLNLAGIHRQVGGQINFTEGTITYEDWNYNDGVTYQASYPSQDGYSRLNEGVVTFREAMSAAGMNESEINSLLNEKGTFKDWTSHSFKMFYMERGSGSGVMRLNFNLPLIPNNSVLVAKNITNENEEYQPILSDPFFNMQFVKCDDDGQPITYATGEKKGKVVPYLEEGTPYMIYENGAYTGRTRYVDENGMVTLRANQFAVITDVAKSGDKYLVRELIPKEFAEQFDKTIVTNNSIFGVGDYQQPDVTHEVSSDPENGEWYPNEEGVMTNYMVRASYPMAPDGVNLSSTLFENNLNSTMLGAIAISKDIIEGDHVWNENDEFNIAVAFDAKPLSATTSANTPATYYVYTKDENGQFEIKGDGETRRVPTDGIITIKANEVAVLRYMLAGSTFEVYEIDNSGTGNYHPIYMKNSETGESVYSGKVTVGSKDDPVLFTISNQRADNLEISKVVENLPADDADMDYMFDVSIAADDRHIDDTYEYEIFSIDDVVDPAVTRELVDRDTAVSLYQEYLATGASLDMDQVKPNRSTITFKDGKASLSLKANQKVIIYGLPYQCNYTVTETSTNGEYQAFYKGTNMSAFANGTVATFVLDSKSTDDGSATTVEFKNRKIEDLSISKTVRVNPIEALAGNENLLDAKFDFSVNNAVYNGVPLVGAYESELSDTYKRNEDGSPKVTKQAVTFENGFAQITLSHGQTITIHGLPHGTTYNVTEADSPNHETTHKATEAEFDTLKPLDVGEVGRTVTSPDAGLTEHQYARFMNTVKFVELPGTGLAGLPIAVLVIGCAALAGWVLYERRHKKRGTVPVDTGADKL